jgi:hypothetical protein
VGVGIAALLSGARRYIGLDVVAYARPAENIELVDELRDLFQRRAPGPVDGWPRPPTEGFPSNILPDERLAASMAPERVEAIRTALRGEPSGRDDVSLEYIAPWTRPDVIEAGSVDFLLSHCVLEYVPDLGDICRSARAWLRRGGLMSHQIDLGAHLLSRRWYGNWVYPRWLWRIVAGGRPFALNLQPASAYLEAIEEAGFEVTRELKQCGRLAPRTVELAPPWRGLSDSDRSCSELFVQARVA